MRFKFENREDIDGFSFVELDELRHATAHYFEAVMTYPFDETYELLHVPQYFVTREAFKCAGDNICDGVYWAGMGGIKFSWQPGDCLSRSALPHEWVHMVLEYYTMKSDPLHENHIAWDVVLWAIRDQTIQEYCQVPASVEHSTELCDEE